MSENEKNVNERLLRALRETRKLFRPRPDRCRSELRPPFEKGSPEEAFGPRHPHLPPRRLAHEIPRPLRPPGVPGPIEGRERILTVLSAGGTGGMHQKDLAAALHLHPSSLSEAISKLTADGYVKRTADPDDGRATLVVLTDLGQARAYELEDEKNERLGRLFKNLSDDEKEQLLALLEKLIRDPDREEC